MADLKNQAEEMRREAVRRAGDKHFLRRPAQTGLGLLCFVSLVGLPLISVPALRERLRSRVEVMRQSLTAGSSFSLPLTVRTGENTEPLPAEYDKPIVPLVRKAEVLVISREAYAATAAPAAAFETGSADQPLLPQAEETEGSQEPVYGQGKIEQEAYKILLDEREPVRRMTEGGDPGLRLKHWSAARTGEDTFLVRLTFQHLADGSDRDYIWEVKLMSREVTPMSAYARAVSRP